MPTKEEYMNALRKADQAGDVAAAKAIARRIQSIGSPAPEPPKEAGGALAFFNKGVANIAGIPIDAASAILRNIPLVGKHFGESGQAFGSGESVRRGMANVGIHTPDRDPEGALEHMGAIGADAVAFAAPILKFGQAATGLQKVGTARAIAKKMTDIQVKKPVTALAAEAGGVAGAGFIRDVAERNDFSPTGAMAAEMAAGLTGSIVAPYASPFRLAKGSLKALSALGNSKMFPWTKKGGFVRAAKRVQSLTPDPKADLKAIEKHKEGYLTAAAKTQNKERLAFEAEVLKLDPAKQTARRIVGEKAMKGEAQNIPGSGNVRDLSSFAAGQRRLLFQTMDDSVAMAKAVARNLFTKAGPKMKNMDEDEIADVASRISQEAMDISKTAAKRQEGILWGATPSGSKVPFSKALNSYNHILKDFSSSELELLPNTMVKFFKKMKADQVKLAEKLLKKEGVPEEQWGARIEEMAKAGKLPQVTTVKELDGQYKVLGDFIANQKNPSGTSASFARTVRKAILEDMKNVQGTDVEKELVKTAREFSRRVNEVFKDGPVGEVLKKGDGGRFEIDPELSLMQTVEKGGQRGAQAQRAIRETGEFASREGFGPIETKAVDNVDEFLRDKFTKAAIKDGDFNPTAAKAFIKKHSQTLSKYPETKKQMKGFIESADAFIEKGKVVDKFKKEADAPSSIPRKIIEGDVVGEIGKAMNHHSPLERMSVLIESTKSKVFDKLGNVTGKVTDEKALQGLRKATGEWLMDHVTTGKIHAASGEPVIDVDGLIRTLRDPDQRQALRKLYGDRLSRLDGIANRLEMLSKQSKSKGGVEINPDEPGWLINFLGTTAGTRIGAKIGAGGSQLKMASTGSTLMKKFIRFVVRDKTNKALLASIDDESLYKALMTHNLKNPKAAAKAERAIKAWMLGVGKKYFTEEESTQGESE